MKYLLSKLLNWLPASPVLNQHKRVDLDYWLLTGCLCLLGLGLVMNASASSAVATAHHGNLFYYFNRHLAYVLVGLAAAFVVLLVPIKTWQTMSWPLLIIGFLLLAVVYVPVIGHEVNGSKRWINLVFFKLQPSELAKLFIVVFIAGYLVRHKEELEIRVFSFARPLLILMLYAVLIYKEPDFGATTVLVGSVVLMIFMANVSLKVAFPLLLILGALGFWYVTAETYRMDRIASIADPWQDQFGTGYQLTQALIAFGRGEWFGLGLGNSIQKQFYLPEAHTDFVFAVLAEELGIAGSLITVALFVFVCGRALKIGRWAELAKQDFAAYCAYGIALIWTAQSFINIGVNLGVLPTKGLTLPFVSYGGSSLVVCCIELAILLRIEWEVRQSHIRKQGGAVMSVRELTSLAKGVSYER